MIFDMIEFARKLAENNIRNQNPGISDIDLKVAVFNRFYYNDLSEQTRNFITNKMRLNK